MLTEEFKISNKYLFNYEADRRSKYLALILLISSFIIFAMSALGFFDWISNGLSDFLLDKLGYTNKWSNTFGPQWLVNLNFQISALGGPLLLSIFFTITILYYHLRNEDKRLWRLVFVIVGGGILLLITKVIFAPTVPDDFMDIIMDDISAFPSGHTMMATIFYGTLIVTISRRQHSNQTKKLTLVSGTILIILIGLSRIIPANHTLKEIIAGWSLGLIWLTLCWFLDRYLKKNRAERKRNLALSKIKM